MNHVADTGPITIGVCSGIGMLEEAVRLVFPECRTAALCEWEAYAAATLLARMEDQSLEQAPVWCGDLREFNAAGFRGVVDIITAGLPCQPYSVAGKKQGNTDARSWGDDGDGPIPGFLRIVDACRPAVVFLENVPTWVRAGWFRPVGDELCRMGYEIVEPVFLAAGDVGASHQRERVFVLAVARGAGCEESGQSRKWKLSAETGTRVHDRPEQCGGILAHTKHARLAAAKNGSSVDARNDRNSSGEVTTFKPSGLRNTNGQMEVILADAGLSGFQGGARTRDVGSRRKNGGQFIAGQSTGIFCPGPSAREWGDILRTSPHLAPAVESGFRSVVDGVAVVVDEARADQLRCVGNGVVALQAAVALVELLRRAKLI